MSGAFPEADHRLAVGAPLTEEQRELAVNYLPMARQLAQRLCMHLADPSRGAGVDGVHGACGSRSDGLTRRGEWASARTRVIAFEARSAIFSA